MVVRPMSEGRKALPLNTSLLLAAEISRERIDTAKAAVKVAPLQKAARDCV
jgi:hypothetical protein